MPREGRSARTRPRRLARRRQESRGYDEGGGRHPFYRRRWFKPIIAIGVVGILLSLVGGSLFILTGSGPQSGSSASSAGGPAPIVRRDDPQTTPVADTDTDTAVDKPQFDAPPGLTLDPGIDYRAVLELESGSVQIDLLEDVAPIHVNNFIFLAQQGFYDNLTFHRVLEGFVAQGGDPTATGTGGAGYTLPDEALDPSGALSLGGHGVLSMARGGAGASSSQFFITLAPQPQLDGLQFTAFGVVTEGIELVQALPLRDPAEIPAPPPGARIVSIRIEEIAKAALDPPGDTTDDADADGAADGG